MSVHLSSSTLTPDGARSCSRRQRKPRMVRLDMCRVEEGNSERVCLIAKVAPAAKLFADWSKLQRPCLARVPKVVAPASSYVEHLPISDCNIIDLKSLLSVHRNTVQAERSRVRHVWASLKPCGARDVPGERLACAENNSKHLRPACWVQHVARPRRRLLNIAS